MKSKSKSAWTSFANKIFIALIILPLCCGFTACSDDDETDEDISTNNSSGNNSSGNGSQLNRPIGTWIDDDVYDFDGFVDCIRKADTYIAQRNYDKARDVVLGIGGFGYKITQNTIYRFQLSVNNRHFSDMTTIKTLYFPDGTHYYLEISQEEACKYTLEEENGEYYMYTDYYPWFLLTYNSNGEVSYLLVKGEDTFGNSKHLYEVLDDISWIR